MQKGLKDPSGTLRLEFGNRLMAIGKIVNHLVGDAVHSVGVNRKAQQRKLILQFGRDVERLLGKGCAKADFRQGCLVPGRLKRHENRGIGLSNRIVDQHETLKIPPLETEADLRQDKGSITEQKRSVLVVEAIDRNPCGGKASVFPPADLRLSIKDGKRGGKPTGSRFAYAADRELAQGDVTDYAPSVLN